MSTANRMTLLRNLCFAALYLLVIDLVLLMGKGVHHFSPQVHYSLWAWVRGCKGLRMNKIKMSSLCIWKNWCLLYFNYMNTTIALCLMED